MRKRGICGMATNIRPEVSKKSEYWLPKQRYFELKHFCMQYRDWKRALNAIDGYSQDSFGPVKFDPTEHAVECRDRYLRKIEMVDRCLELTDPVLKPYLQLCICDGRTYEQQSAIDILPCGKDKFYKLYRKFFWLLNDIREDFSSP